MAKTIQFRYIIFYDDKVPVGIAATQYISFNTNELKLHEFPCSISGTITNTLFKNTDIKVLVCGNLFSCGEHGFSYTDRLTATDAFENLSNALRELSKIETTDKPSFILLKEFWPASFNNSDSIKKQDFRDFKIDVNMVLPIRPEWNDFNMYLGSMKTKFRTRAKKVFKNSSEIIVKSFNPDDILFYAKKINSLYLSVIEKADFKVEKLNASIFQNLKKNLGDSFIFKGYFLEDRLVGFKTAFILKDALEANHIGIDYEYNKTHDIYQKMLYNYVALAISKKVPELRLGRTAEIIKSSIGAEPVEMKLYVRHCNSISNALLKPLVDLISPSDYEIRHPFKLQVQ
ncbi:hypothetical protein [Aquimarina addita]|uniref:hypothetical protein n=1 Tax=Aquimarina addita TaxID=870485 RepID=UPI0031F16FD0